MDETGTLYKLTFPNGKSYIGITKHSIEHRIKIHIRASRSGRKLAIYNAIRKYGEDSFKVQVLAMDNPDNLPMLEISAIKRYGTFGVGGYNLTAGGEGTLGRSFTVSEETKQKISISRIGKRPDYQHSDETKRKISERNKGKVISEESKAKMSAAAKNRQARNRLEKGNIASSIIF
jgi:group I intron endonuclease